MFFRGSQRAGFRPRAYNSGRFQFLLPLVVGLVSGYYIFNEPLKQAAIEVKAKAALTEAGDGSSSSSSSNGEGKIQSNGVGNGSNERRNRN